jgi:ribosome modulation factor
MTDIDFRLSRVHAAGWNRARRFSAADGEPRAGEIDAINPYKKDPERARWLMGFRGALGLEETK